MSSDQECPTEHRLWRVLESRYDQSGVQRETREQWLAVDVVKRFTLFDTVDNSSYADARGKSVGTASQKGKSDLEISERRVGSEDTSVGIIAGCVS